MSWFSLEPELGAGLDERIFRACISAMQRCRRILGEAPSDPESRVERLLFSREFLKVLGGQREFLFDPICAELGRVHDSRAATRLKQRWIAMAEEELTPNDDDDGRYFDPLAWRIERLPHGSPGERLLRLALFVDCMLEQEDGFADAEVSLLEVARTVVEADEHRRSRETEHVDGMPCDRVPAVAPPLRPQDRAAQGSMGEVVPPNGDRRLAGGAAAAGH